MSFIYLLIFFIFLLILAAYIKPKKAGIQRSESKIEPCVDRESIINLSMKADKKAEDHFTLGMVLADEIDNKFVPEVFQHLTTAMELIEREDRINDDHAFMVRRAGDIHQIGTLNIDDIGDFELGLALDQAINGANIKIKQKSAADKMSRAANLETKQEKREVLFEGSYTSDSQNTHERGVLNDTSAIITMIRSDLNGADISDAQLFAEIDAHGKVTLDAAKYRRMKVALNKAAERIDIFALGENECDILRLVWLRSMAPQNAPNMDLIKDAICCALIDSVDAHTMKPVCVSGRATRIVGALATLDYDKKASIVMTHEMYKNEIFNDTKKIIEREISEATGNRKEMAAAYEDGDESENEFTASLRKKIEDNIANYRIKLSVAELDDIKKTCLTFAGL